MEKIKNRDIIFEKMQLSYRLETGRNMIKIVSILGTRPEAIKMAPVINELGKHADNKRTFQDIKKCR